MPTTAEPPFVASRYTTGAIVLHWTIALLIIVQIAGGWAMHEFLEDGSPLQFQIYQLHKSFGITVLVLTVARILWRAFNPPPPEPASVSRLEGIASHLVHMAFYGLMVLIPLSGWALITLTPIQVETKLFFLDWLPWPNLPLLGSFRGEAAGEFAEEVHAILAYLALALVALHVAGAVKHHLEDGAFIARMSPSVGGDGPRNSYGQATTTVVTLAFLALMVGAAAYARWEPVETAVVSPDQPIALTRLGDDTASPAAAAAAGPAPAWQVDTAASRLTFTFGAESDTVRGEFGSFTPEIRFDPDNLEGSSIAADIDLSSVAVEGGMVSLNQVKGPEGLDASAEPTARFTADTVTADGEGYVAEGSLTLRGADVPVRLPFTLRIDDAGRARAEGSAELERAAFGIGDQATVGGMSITPGVTVEVVIEATRSDAGAVAAGD